MGSVFHRNDSHFFHIQGAATVNLPVQVLGSIIWSILHVQELPLFTRGGVVVLATCHCKLEIARAWPIFV